MMHRRRVRAMIAAAIVSLSLATSVTPPAGAAGQTYVVRAHDTLSTIAQAYGTTVSALMAANNLSNPNLITVGQVLVVSPGSAATLVSAVSSGATYSVQPGDTLSAIGARYGVSLDALASSNNISNPSSIFIGQQLTIPASGYAPASAVAAPATASGYVVRWGDTLSAISQRFGLTIAAIESANGLNDGSVLHIGQQLAIPAGGGGPTPYSGNIESILTAQAQAAGVDVGLVKAVAWQESGWQMVTASDGGMGVMQLMPDAVSWVSSTLLGYQVNPYDPTDNIRAGVAMLHYYLGVFAGDERMSLAAYHQGLTSVQTQGISAETEGYIANILSLQQQYGG